MPIKMVCCVSIVITFIRKTRKPSKKERTIEIVYGFFANFSSKNIIPGRM